MGGPGRAWRQASGFALRDFIAFGLAISPWFINQSELRGTFTPERQSINPNTLFSQARIDRDVAARLLTNLTHDYDSLVTALRTRLSTARPGISHAYDFLPFMIKPLYRVREDVIVPFDLTYLGAKFSSGIYWTIFDSLHGAQKKQFTRFVGRIFEVYVRRAVQRAIPDAAGLVRRVYPEFIYRVTAGERRSSDVIVLYDQTAIFMEATASRIRMEETAISGDLGAFDRDIDKIILQNARQLTNRIRDFRDGHYTIGGLTARDIQTILPVIVTLQSVPEATPIWDYLNEQLRKKHLLQEPGVEALQLLNVEEIEILEAILRQGHSQLELLRQRMADPERRHISMKNFLIARFEERGVNEYLLGQYRELGEHITALLFGERN